jgi:LL-diaminopimelate aminotransferase
MRVARRVESLPPYLFAQLDRKVAARRAEGADVISLGVGDPDLPTPQHVVEALREAVADPATHRYPSYDGLPALRQAIAEFYRARFGVALDPDTEVLPLIGSKEGLAHLAFSVLDAGDQALVPDPGYPVYATSTTLAGATPRFVQLEPSNDFLPDLDEVRTDRAVKLFWLNYPNNPTAAVADPTFFERAVAFAADRDLLLAHDAAYTEITFDGYVAPSALAAPGAKDHVIEFGSLSKTYNMTGWRVGFAVGGAKAVGALATLKTNLDSGIFTAVQGAAVAALTGPQDHVERMRGVYRTRRDVVVAALQDVGVPVKAPLGSIYVWVPVPGRHTAVSFAEELLDEAAVVVAPGTGYGRHGEGFVRISLTVADDRLEEAMARIRNRLS